MNRSVLPHQTIEVNSTAINSAEYNYADYELSLSYKNGFSYTYAGVPSHVFEGLRISSSKGKFLNRHIIRNYSLKSN